MSDLHAPTGPGSTRPLDALRRGDSALWPHIAKAEETSRKRLAELARLAKELAPADEGAIVVFGSMARREFTDGSDLDWAILIDGRADSRHQEIVHEFKRRLDPNRFKSPGPTDLFGGLVFSHDLIHAIGGDDDTNRNMTRRLLLLLESAAVPVDNNEAVRARIVEAILDRYVKEDASFLMPGDTSQKIPRFLLNDVVRLWRTMAVDYANKYRVRDGQKWALRNIKLRMSRKLLFVSGLFMCISWLLHKREHGDTGLSRQQLIDHLLRWTEITPLDSLAVIVKDYAPHLGSEIFDSYDSFLGMLDNNMSRQQIEGLSPDKACEDKAFLEARENSAKFNDALVKLLFDSNKDVTPLVQRYGVF